MRNKIVMIVALLAMMVAMTGIAAAGCDPNGDCLTARWTGTQIEAKAWNLMSNWYEIRFYAPGVLPVSFESIVTTHNNPGDTEYPFYVGNKFAGSTCTLNSPCVRTYTPTSLIQGEWLIVLMKDGTEKNPNPTVQDSYRVSTSVNIPEFPTIALPIAAVIGLVFFFQHKKKKEE